MLPLDRCLSRDNGQEMAKSNRDYTVRDCKNHQTMGMCCLSYAHHFCLRGRRLLNFESICLLCRFSKKARLVSVHDCVRCALSDEEMRQIMGDVTILVDSVERSCGVSTVLVSFDIEHRRHMSLGLALDLYSTGSDSAFAFAVFCAAGVDWVTRHFSNMSCPVKTSIIGCTVPAHAVGSCALICFSQILRRRTKGPPVLGSD